MESKPITVIVKHKGYSKKVIIKDPMTKSINEFIENMINLFKLSKMDKQGNPHQFYLGRKNDQAFNSVAQKDKREKMISDFDVKDDEELILWFNVIPGRN
jgi:mevalonate pyrophosphate decarboxylase